MESLDIDCVTLVVQNLEPVVAFYRDMVGLHVVTSDAGKAMLGYGDQALLELVLQKDAVRPRFDEAGLYHTAFVFGSRRNLAEAIVRIYQTMPQLYEGSADHLATEAFYFHDPEGNGVELYFDRPRSEWQFDGGIPVMGSLPLDTGKFVSDHIETPEKDGTVKVGHIHLKIGDVSLAKQFYADTLRFEIMFIDRSVLFVSRDTYHHHIGMNTWESFGAQRRREGRSGLASFTIAYRDEPLFNEVLKGLQNGSYTFDRVSESEIHIRDPWDTLIILKKSR